jgi:ferrochelatase
LEDNTDSSVGVLLLNLGGPDSLRAVKPFLFNLFSDREIIRLGPSFLQKPIAWLISSLRHRKTEEFYGQIGGKSPICEITFAQAKALEEVLKKSGVSGQWPGARVYVAMRYWHPLIEDVIPEIHKDGIRRLIVLSLYPQYSVATTGSTLRKLGEVVSKYPLEIFSIRSWYDNQLYIDALVEEIRNGLEAFKDRDEPSVMGNESGPKERHVSGSSDSLRVTHDALRPHVLFSAHSLPVKFIEEGDPYADQIQATINEVVSKIDIQWSLSYQSKSGPVQWLGPSTDEMIEKLAEKETRNLLVVPISFVSDHIETLYEIDILYRGMAEKLGMRLERVRSLNTSPLFISALQQIVVQGIKEAGWLE